jgi:hypothetical protein
MAQHKWHKEIKAWADGAEIESNGGCGWFRDASPDWNDEDFKFRIKPQPKEPQYLYAYQGRTDVWLSLQPLDTSNYIGKIKLEDEDV